MEASGPFVAYYRVSTARQGASGLGLEAQRSAVARYLNGGDWRIMDEFTEVESGKRSDRPQLDAALKAARVHRCPLVVAKVDRLTRSSAFFSRLLEAGVDVRFADLPDVQGPQGKFLLQSMAAVAELERGMIGTRTKDALAAAKARGVTLGGYRGHTVTPEAREAGRATRTANANARASDLGPIVRPMVDAGASLRSIAAALTERGVPTPSGKAVWNATQVRRTVARLEVGAGA